MQNIFGYIFKLKNLNGCKKDIANIKHFKRAPDVYGKIINRLVPKALAALTGQALPKALAALTEQALTLVTIYRVESFPGAFIVFIILLFSFRTPGGISLTSTDIS